MPCIDAQRAKLLAIFSQALQAVNGRERVRAYLKIKPLTGPVYVIAMGKAACPMALGAQDYMGDHIADAWVVTKQGYAELMPWPCYEAGHPLPDERSLDAGESLSAFIRNLPLSAQVLVLLSGGASTLVERPISGVGISELRAVNTWLLSSGLDIATCNRVRKALSLIKGGRLAAQLAPRRVICLALSDVRGDDPAVIGSGPLSLETGPPQPFPPLPAFIQDLVSMAPAPPASVKNVSLSVLATLEDAKHAAAESAAGNYRVQRHQTFIHGDACQAGAQLARALVAGPADTLHIWGGETTVSLPPKPGRGGRNQSLALAAAQVIAGHDDCLFLAAGTDGTDGPGEDAGALVDGETITRGRVHAGDAQAVLVAADAGSFLAASGDLLHTGPTGTNVMDLMFGLKIKI